MDEQLQSFVNDYLYLADTRNVSYDNPVTLELEPDSRTFQIVVGYSEPSFSQLPYNVLWICYDENDAWAHKIYRRLDHNSSELPTHEGKKYTWEELTLFEQLYDTDQFYQAVDETPAHELGASWVNVGPASDVVGGLVTVTDDTGSSEEDYSPIAISEKDPRNTDARIPTEHSHPDGPRTMVHIDGNYVVSDKYTDLVGDEEYFVSFDKARLPEPGQVFFLTGNNPERPNEWYGEWRLPTEADIFVDHPHIESVNIRIISEPETISDNTNLTLDADSLYDDGTTIVSDQTSVWSVSDNTQGVIIDSNSGVLSIPDLDADLSVDITSVCSDANWPGETALGTITLNIKDLFEDKVLMGLSILGPDSIQELTSDEYLVEATFNDNSKEYVSADTFTSSNTDVAQLVGETLTALDILVDTPTNLYAEYTYGGSTLNTTKQVTVIADVVPTMINIIGPNAMNELESLDLQAEVSFSDGTTRILTVAETTWSVASTPENIIITPGTDSVNYESTADIDSDYVFTVGIQATIDDQTFTDSLDVTVIDATVPKVISTFEIVGPSSLNEQTISTEYTFLVTYTDSTSRVVYADAESFTTSNTVDTTVVDYEVDEDLNVIKGTLESTTDITSDIDVTLYATYTENGNTVNTTLSVTIVADPPVAQSLDIIGPVELNENNYIDLIARVTFDDGSTLDVSGTDSSYTTLWTYDVTGTGVSDSAQATTQRYVSIEDIAADEDFTVRASVDVDGVVLEDTSVITLKDVPLVPTGISILGVSSIEENSNTTYTFEVSFSNGTKETLTEVDLVEVDNDLLASITDSGEFTSLEVTEDTDIVISVNHIYNDVTLTDSHTVTISDIPTPQSLAILGQETVGEQGNFNYSFKVVYSDGSEVSLSDVDSASSNLPAGTFTNSGNLNTADIQEDVSITLSASTNYEGVDLTATLDVLVVADPVPVSLEIIGNETVNEETTETYTFLVTMSDSSTKYVNPVTLESSETYATVDNVASGRVSFLDVNGNQSVNITATYFEQGINLTDTLSVNILDVISPASMIITGPSSVDEFESEAYTFEVTMSDGSTKDVTATSASTDLGTFNTSGTFTAPEVTADTSNTLSATYTENGVNVSANLEITITNSVIKPVSVSISGPTQMDENDTINLIATVTYEDGTSNVVTSSSFWSRRSGTAASINADSGLVTSVENVSTNSPVSFGVEYTELGVTVDDTHTVSVVNTNNRLESLSITGPDEVDEDGGNLNLVATASYESGDTSNVTSPSTWTILSGASGGTISSSGVFTPSSDVDGDTTVTVQASYSEGGITKTATHDILVEDIAKPQSLTTSGPTEVLEGESINFNTILTRTDGSNENVTTNPNTTWSVSSGPGTISSSGVYSAPNEVNEDTPATILVSYTDLGVTVTDTRNVTVKNIAASGYTPRWGLAPQVTALADYNDAFMTSLTNSLSGTNGEEFDVTPSSTDYLYMAWPESLGFAQIQEEGTSNPGGFDGATDLEDENTFEYDDGAGDETANSKSVYLYDGSTSIGGLRVEIDGTGYIIYRKVYTRSTNFGVTIHEYNTPNRLSQHVN